MGYFRKTIEQMTGYTSGFQSKQPGAVKLNTNENPWPASPKVLEAIGNLTAENLQKYPEAAGDSFRKAAAAVLGIDSENIICTNDRSEFLLKNPFFTAAHLIASHSALRLCICSLFTFTVALLMLTFTHSSMYTMNVYTALGGSLQRAEEGGALFNKDKPIFPVKGKHTQG